MLTNGFCSIFVKIQAIIFGQNCHLKTRGNEKFLHFLPPLGIEDNAKFGISILLNVRPFYLQEDILIYYMAEKLKSSEQKYKNNIWFLIQL